LDVQKPKISRKTAIRLRENLSAQTNRYKRIRRAAADKTLLLVVFFSLPGKFFSYFQKSYLIIFNLLDKYFNFSSSVLYFLSISNFI